MASGLPRYTPLNDTMPVPGAGALAPWTMTGAIAGEEARIYFQPAMVNNTVPKIGAEFLDALVPPYLVVTGAAGVTYARATVDGAGTMTDLEILNAAALPADTSVYKHRRIGSWTSGGGVFTSVVTILNTNQLFRLCDGAAEWI